MQTFKWAFLAFTRWPKDSSLRLRHTCHNHMHMCMIKAISDLRQLAQRYQADWNWLAATHCCAQDWAHLSWPSPRENLTCCRSIIPAIADGLDGQHCGCPSSKPLPTAQVSMAIGRRPDAKECCRVVDIGHAVKRYWGRHRRFLHSKVYWYGCIKRQCRRQD